MVGVQSACLFCVCSRVMPQSWSVVVVVVILVRRQVDRRRSFPCSLSGALHHRHRHHSPCTPTYAYVRRDSLQVHTTLTTYTLYLGEVVRPLSCPCISRSPVSRLPSRLSLPSCVLKSPHTHTHTHHTLHRERATASDPTPPLLTAHHGPRRLLSLPARRPTPRLCPH